MTPLCIDIIEDTPQRFECAVSDRSGEILQRWSVTAPKPWIMAMHRIAILDVAIPNFNAQLYINSKGIHIG